MCSRVCSLFERLVSYTFLITKIIFAPYIGTSFLFHPSYIPTFNEESSERGTYDAGGVVTTPWHQCFFISSIFIYPECMVFISDLTLVISSQLLPAYHRPTICHQNFSDNNYDGR